MRRWFLSICFLAALPLSVSRAGLLVRGTDTSGNKLIYDSVLDVTWYDYRYGTDGWEGTVAWAEGLSVNFGGNIYDDWRLPHALPVNGTSHDYNWSADGSTDIGKNITSPNAELSHLFYVTLGNSYVDDADYYPGIHNHGPFEYLEDWYYWYGTEYQGPPANGDTDTDGDGTPDVLADTRGFFFLFYNGFQDSWGGMSNIGMAVRDGDVAVIPEPSTIIIWSLLGALAITVGWWRRRRTT